MAKLSILIPLQDGEFHRLKGLTSSLLADASQDIEIVAGYTDAPASLAGQFPEDPRIKLAAFAAEERSQQSRWAALIGRAAGDWVTLIHVDDALEPALATMAAFIENANPSVSAFAWHTLEIDPLDDPARRMSIAVPTEANITMLDKAVMLQAFFMWEKSGAAPRMPFGLHHGAIRRTLADDIVASLTASGRISPTPRYDWAARTLLLAEQIAYCPRPMSAINRQSFSPDPSATPAPDFPLHRNLGVSGAIAEIQHAVFQEMSAKWGGGAEANFARACMIDCMAETEPGRFAERAQTYRDALSRWNVNAAKAFQPSFSGGLPKEERQGLVDGTLFVNRFIGGATDARRFYHVLRSFLLPVAQFCR